MNLLNGKTKRLISSWAKGARLTLLGLGILAISLTALLPVAVSYAQAVSFSAATNFAAGTSPFSVVMGDLNGDGKLDLAVANHNHTVSDVSVLLGTGAGAFGPATNFAVGTNPRDMAIGDLNGDGKLDLAVANEDSNNVSILLNTTTTGELTPSFAAANFGVGARPVSVEMGDLNGDGNLDLAVANYTSDTVSVLLGTGAGAFDAATNFAVGDGPHSVAMGDLNGDGKPDLTVVNQVSETVSVLLGTGAGTFDAATNFAVGASPRSVALGDFNGDGKLDLAVANFFNDTVSVLLGTGAGAFDAATNFAVGDGPIGVEIGDFNGDGKPDLAVVNHFSNNISVLLGAGAGSFSLATDFAVGTSPHSVAIGDLNGDGKLDLAVANITSNNVSVLLNTTVVTPAEAIQNLINTINGMGLPAGVANSLTAPLKQAAALLNDDNPNNDVAACGKLDAFINQVNAKAKSGQLTSDQANPLLQAANAIKASLSC